MPATLVWGKGFQTKEITLRSGRVSYEVLGIDGGMEMISWSSVAEIRALAEKHGISGDIWPVYEGYEIEGDVPLNDAQERSAELRVAFEQLDPRVLSENHWLGFVDRILRDGNSFFVMS